MIDRPTLGATNDAVSADLIAQRGFTVSRRGFDQDEVREFLLLVAGAVRGMQQRDERLEASLAQARRAAESPELDEDTLMRLVGEETSSILRSARATAAEMRSRAETETTEVRLAAEAESTAVREAAESDSSALRAEAEAASAALRKEAAVEVAALREATDRETTELRVRAEAEAARIVDEARQSAGDLLTEAESALGRATVEANLAASEIREAAQSSADDLVGRARLDAESLRQGADHDRDTAIADAEARRAEILGDLEERRVATLAQVEQLRQGRDSLIETYAVIRRTLEEADGALQGDMHSPPVGLDLTDASIEFGEPGEPAAEVTPLSETIVVGVADLPEPAARGEAAETQLPSPGDGGATSSAGPEAAAPAPLPDDQGPTSRAGRVGLLTTPEVAPPARKTARSTPRAASTSARTARGPLRSKAVRPSAVPSDESGEAANGQLIRPETSQLDVAAPEAAEAGPTELEAVDDRNNSEIPALETPAHETTGSETTGSETTGSETGVLASGVDSLFARLRAGRSDAVAQARALLDEDGPGVSGRTGAGDAVAQARALLDEDGPGVSGRTGAGDTAPADQAATDQDATDQDATYQAATDQNVTDQSREAQGGPGPVAAALVPAADVRTAEPAVRSDHALEPPRSNEEESWLQGRDEALGEVESALTRKLKRAVQDEQNDLLDRLRSFRGRATANSLLAGQDEQKARFVRAANLSIEEAARKGAAFARAALGDADGPAGAPPLVDEVVDEVASSIVDPLRRRLDKAIRDVGDDDQAVLIEALGAAYREWKTQRIERIAGDGLTAAFSLGVVHATPAGVALRWVADDVDGPCSDCDDNVLAGALSADEVFPTGQLRPPAHAGCRCIVVPFKD